MDASAAVRAALPPQPAHPPPGFFDVILPKAVDGSLGIIVRENALASTASNLKRVIGYKPVVRSPAGAEEGVNGSGGSGGPVPAARMAARAAGEEVNGPGSGGPPPAGGKPMVAVEMGPAERTGYLRENDILAGVDGLNVLEARFEDAVALIRAAPRQGVHLRILRPELTAQRKGVVTFEAAFPASAVAEVRHAVPAATELYAAVVNDGLGNVHAYGPFGSADEAAVAFDSVVLASYGLRAAVHTNAFAFMATAVSRAERIAKSAAAAGDIDGVVKALRSVETGPFTYAGKGYIVTPPLLARVMVPGSDTAATAEWSSSVHGQPIRYFARPETAAETAKRAQAANAKQALHAAYPGLALLGDRQFMEEQWGRESVPVANDTEESIRAQTVAGTTQAPQALAALSALDDEDDGNGHADVRPPGNATALLTPEAARRVAEALGLPSADDASALKGRQWVVDVAAGLRDTGALLSPSGMPLPLQGSPSGPPHGPTMAEAPTHPSLGDDVWVTPQQRAGRLRGERIRALPSTTLYRARAIRGATAHSASAAADAVSLETIFANQLRPATLAHALLTDTARLADAPDTLLAQLSTPGVQSRLARVGGGLGQAHPLYRGVTWDVQGGGAYAVYQSSTSYAPPMILGYFATATQAALAYDRFVRRVDPTGSRNIPTNFTALLAPAVLTLAVENVRAGRPELFGTMRDMFDGAATAPKLPLDESTLVDPTMCTLSREMVHPTVQGSVPSLHALASTLLDPARNALLRNPVYAKAIATMPAPPSHVVDPALRAQGITWEMKTEPVAMLRVSVNPDQREVIRNQILVMKSLMRNMLPPPASFIAATRFDVDPNAALRSRRKSTVATPPIPGGALRPGASADAIMLQRVAMANTALPGTARTRTGKVFTGRKKRRSKKRAADEDEDEEESEEEGDNWKRAKPSGPSQLRRSGRERKSTRYNAGGDEEEEEEESAPEEASDEEVERAPGPRRRKSAPKRGASQAAAHDSESENQWRVERILAVRYAEVPAPPGEAINESLPEDEQARQHDALQLKLRRSMPLDERRDWSTLEYLVRYKGMSYLHVEWVAASLMKEQGPWGVIKARKYVASPEAARQLDDEEERMEAGRDPLPNEAFFDEDFIAVERIIASKEVDAEAETPTSAARPAAGGRRTMYLVKWRGLPYSECTWEWAEDIKHDKKIAQFRRFDAAPRLEDAATQRDASRQDIRPDPSQFRPYKESPVFKAGRMLRDYQLEGLNWMVFNWHHRRNCILADEMGLGKTVQSVSMLEHLRKHCGVRGPFLVLAPLSTLGHWKREFDEWTDMNAVYYHDPLGGAEAREMIRENEWKYSGPRGVQLANSGVYKFNAIVTSYHVLLSDWEHFQRIRWRYVIVDEAHALKNKDSQLQQALQAMEYDSLLLLTGTPLQNDVQELWALLALIRPDKFPDARSFIARFGELKDSKQVAELQQELAPIMLRRAKEDVEKSIPPKEETLINVELTRLQKAYYRAVLERNRSFLMRGATSNAASLVNIEMELRKCCDHPFLLRGAETRETMHCRTREERVDAMVAASGKMVLLDKLLPKLRSEGHRVLIFSQFKTMLSLIEELLSGRGYKYERIDGSIRGNERQAAIDRFNEEGSQIFAFLLSTKAGGQGINLTAADTVIIFDSDWNPQNDVQAMARAHRIGQTKDVRIYRLITSKTYEAQMFQRASRKLGLSQAVFESGGVAKRLEVEGEEGQELSGLLTMDKDKVEALLRFGAYAIMDDEDANAAAAQFQSSTIDQILMKSSTIRYDETAAKEAELAADAAAAGESLDSKEAREDAAITGAAAGAAGGRRAPLLNLSKATFAVDEGDTKLDVKDPSFWEKVLGPKPADALLRDMQEGVLDDPQRSLQWVADLTALLDDVFEARCNGEMHDAADTLQSVLLELQVLGKRIPHPLSDAGRARVTEGEGKHPGAPFEFPDPTPTLNTVLRAESLSHARLRARAANGRGDPPEVDGSGEQHSGTLAAFADYWMDRLEQGRRARKRARTQLPSQPDLSILDDEPVRGRGRGRPRGRGRGGRAGGRSLHDGGGDDSESLTGMEDGEGAAGRKRGRGSKDAAAAATEGEVELREEDGVVFPSVSNLRIRLTPVVATAGKPTPSVVPFGPTSRSASIRPSAWSYDFVRLPPEAAPAADGAAAPAPIVAEPEDPTNPHSAAAMDDATRTRFSGVREFLMPRFLFDVTGYTRAELYAAAAAGKPVQEHVADARLLADDTSDAAQAQLRAISASLAASPALTEFETARTRTLVEWQAAAQADKTVPAAAFLPRPQPAEGNDAMLRVPVLPMRVVGVFSPVSTRVTKPSDAKGPRGMAPGWTLGGLPADHDEEAKRANRKAAAAKKSALKREQALAAKEAEGASMAEDTPSHRPRRAKTPGETSDADEQAGMDEDAEDAMELDDDAAEHQDDDDSFEGGDGAESDASFGGDGDDDDYAGGSRKRARRASTASSRGRGGKPKGRGAAKAAPKSGGRAKGAKATSAAPDASASLDTLPAPDDAVCCVCNNAEGFLDDPIVICEGADCGIAVHKNCYGIDVIPPGDAPYFCAVCAARNREAAAGASVAITPLPAHLPCALCTLTGGAYKPCAPTLAGNPSPRDNHGRPFTTSGWAHVVCAVWNPHVRFADPMKMEPIVGWERARQTKEWAQRCTVCDTAETGCCVTCAVPGCPHTFHPLCGRRAQLRMEMTPAGELRAFCDPHRAITDEQLQNAASAGGAQPVIRLARAAAKE